MKKILLSLVLLGCSTNLLAEESQLNIEPVIPKGMATNFSLPIGTYINELSKQAGYVFLPDIKCDLEKRVEIGIIDSSIIEHFHFISYNNRDYNLYIMEQTKEVLMECNK